jgi:hypothetical protein
LHISRASHPTQDLAWFGLIRYAIGCHSYYINPPISHDELKKLAIEGLIVPFFGKKLITDYNKTTLKDYIQQGK